MKNILSICVLGLMTASVVAGPNPPKKKADDKRPNVLIILTDDMGYSDIGAFGGKFVPTPNIDRLAGMGRIFNNYYSAAPICSPSRAGLLTGQFPAR